MLAQLLFLFHLEQLIHWSHFQHYHYIQLLVQHLQWVHFVHQFLCELLVQHLLGEQLPAFHGDADAKDCLSSCELSEKVEDEVGGEDGLGHAQAGHAVQPIRACQF